MAIPQKKRAAPAQNSASARPTQSRRGSQVQARTPASRSPARRAEPIVANRAREASQDVAKEPSNSIERVLDVLSLFTPAAPAWTSDSLVRSLGVSRSTGYRYIKALSDAGLLTPVAHGQYVLGPRIIQLDRQIRQCDPLYIGSGAVLRQLMESTKFSAQVYALFRNSALCIRESLIPDSPPNIASRGEQRPLFLGAATKCIVAHLRHHQLRSLYTKYSKTIAAAGLGADWPSFRENLASIRAAGYVRSVGEVNPGIFGIFAPIFNRDGHVLGSVGVTGSAHRLTESDHARIVPLVLAAAEQVTQQIRNTTLGLDRAARALG